MRPSRDLDRLRLRAVPGDRAQLMPVGADHVGQHMGIRGIAFRPRHRVPLPIPRRLTRVHRIHRVPGSEQRLHPYPAVGLDPNRHLARRRHLATMDCDQLMQPGHTIDALDQPRTSNHPARRVLNLHIVMAFGPVITNDQQPRYLLVRLPTTQRRGEHRGLMDQCSIGTTPHQRSRSPHTQQGHGLAIGINILPGGTISAHLLAATGQSLPCRQPRHSH